MLPSFIDTDAQRLLRDSASDFLQAHAPISTFRSLRDRDDRLGYDPELWSAFAEQGYCGVLVPEEFGGLGLGAVEAGILAETLGRHLTPSPFLSTSVLASSLIVATGSAAQREKWLPALVQARAVVALAIDGRSRHNPDDMHVRAEPGGDAWLLHGSKTFVIDGHAADAFVVAAHDANGGAVLLLVPSGTPGVTVERLVLVDGRPVARLTFSNASVDSGAMLALGASASEALARTLDLGRVVVACELLGLAGEAFARTVQYMKDRRQFGRAIGEFQALQHRAAALWCELQLSASLVDEALHAWDQRSAEGPLRTAQAKARAGATAALATQEAVQIHGGIGMTDELDIGLFLKRAKVLQSLLGDTGFLLDRAARLQGY